MSDAAPMNKTEVQKLEVEELQQQKQKQKQKQGEDDGIYR